MTRIHGNKKLARRSDVTSHRDYHDYLEDLRIDFKDTCGYCGKTTDITKNAFEIDHFVPVVIDESKRNNYNNLVYSCYQCNRKKHDKWPTRDTNISHNDIEGFVDPATEEYDNHLERTENGDIVGKTDVGNYMVKALAFDERPIREIWKLMKLVEKRDYLLKLDSKNPEIIECWQEVSIQINNLLKYMFDKKE